MEFLSLTVLDDSRLICRRQSWKQFLTLNQKEGERASKVQCHYSVFIKDAYSKIY